MRESVYKVESDPSPLRGRAHSFYVFVFFFAGENGIFTLSRSIETMTCVLHFHVVDLIVHNAQELPLPLDSPSHPPPVLQTCSEINKTT